MREYGAAQVVDHLDQLRVILLQARQLVPHRHRALLQGLPQVQIKRLLLCAQVVVPVLVAALGDVQLQLLLAQLQLRRVLGRQRRLGLRGVRG